MKVISALEAKNAFGRFLAAAQREPVAVTRNRRLVATMFSMEDIASMARAYLSEPLREQVASGAIDVSAALLRQAHMNESITLAREEAASGKTLTMDDQYFDGLRAHVRAVSRTRPE